MFGKGSAKRTEEDRYSRKDSISSGMAATSPKNGNIIIGNYNGPREYTYESTIMVSEAVSIN